MKNRTLKPIEVELLLTESQRRVSVAGHHEFRESIAPTRPFDEIDEFVAELRELKPEGIDQ